MNKNVERLEKYLGAFIKPRVQNDAPEDVAEALRLIADRYDAVVEEEDTEEDETD